MHTKIGIIKSLVDLISKHFEDKAIVGIYGDFGVICHFYDKVDSQSIFWISNNFPNLKLFSQNQYSCIFKFEGE